MPVVYERVKEEFRMPRKEECRAESPTGNFLCSRFKHKPTSLPHVAIYRAWDSENKQYRYQHKSWREVNV